MANFSDDPYDLIADEDVIEDESVIDDDSPKPVEPIVVDPNKEPVVIPDPFDKVPSTLDEVDDPSAKDLEEIELEEVFGDKD